MNNDESSKLINDAVELAQDAVVLMGAVQRLQSSHEKIQLLGSVFGSLKVASENASRARSLLQKGQEGGS